MKTLTFILYFVAILGLIEANWRVTQHRRFSRSERVDFLRYVRSAILQGGDYSDRMTFLSRKMEQEQGGDWHCFYGDFAGGGRSNKHITVRKGTNEILCFS